MVHAALGSTKYYVSNMVHEFEHQGILQSATVLSCDTKYIYIILKNCCLITYLYPDTAYISPIRTTERPI